MKEMLQVTIDAGGDKARVYNNIAPTDQNRSQLLFMEGAKRNKEFKLSTSPMWKSTTCRGWIMRQEGFKVMDDRGA